MSVYYYKLWKLLERKNIDAQGFFEGLHISTGTVVKLRKDSYVSLDTLDRIRECLGCDFGDIITAKPDKNAGPKDWLSENVSHASDICRNELKRYMAANSLSVSDIMQRTTLSRNTIKSFLNGATMTSRTMLRLFRLDGFVGGLGIAYQEAGFKDDGFSHLDGLKNQSEK